MTRSSLLDSCMARGVGWEELNNENTKDQTIVSRYSELQGQIRFVCFRNSPAFFQSQGLRVLTGVDDVFPLASS